ncbi:GNAT family N-acetyltransferase [Labrys monachus]|uniref:Ribosomal protein S18 acetylase RimI-like enzyme n=1 Tax=Labrys monachus TaxID=217067 RepID=A0ABU0FES0_9HYPH|nr:GNAT family N-acetyltransferase [Labrys monachus]MDQ0392598.1 ribosomal protein S18 acetylase RimI-like enzyme [Labrys monachus]
MTSLRLRQATRDDLPSLMDLETAAFATDRIARRSWLELLASPAAAVTVVAEGPAVIGCSVVLRNARTRVARLYSIAVSRQARRQGIARLLIEDAAHRAGRAGATELRLETRFDNLPAQRLFERSGFRPFKRVAGYYQDGAEAIRYRRPVSPPHRDDPAPPHESRPCQAK